MIIFKKMFAEKILRFHEAMNRFSELLMRMPHLGDKIRNQIEENDNYRLKMTFKQKSTGKAWGCLDK